MDEEEAQFEAAMRGLHAKAKDIGYNASRFIEMIDRDGAVKAAHRLLQSSTPSDGFTKLWELGRLDISLEALVLEHRFRGLFSTQEQLVARRRLEAYGWDPRRRSAP